MATTKMDAAVKGSASPSKEKEAASAPTSGVTQTSSAIDPLASLPSSPPQIYLNLLILECSLRTQYLELRARRRQHTFFLTILLLWIAYFTYALFLAPREDGMGVGGSVYWVVEMGEKVAFMGGIVTGMLVWGTGQWERGVRYPRRWVGITNRGLRGFNLKIVVVKKSMVKEWIETLKFFIDGGLWKGVDTSNYRFIPPHLHNDVKDGRRNSNLPNISEENLASGAEPNTSPQQEDLSPGGDTISLLLLPKPFSPAFRENWELYRTAYWESENTRRSALLKKLHAHDRAVLAKARKEAGWFSWLRITSPFNKPKSKADLEKSTHLHHSHSHNHHLKPTEKRLRSSSNARSGSHSRNSSRASTPLLEPVDASQNTTTNSSNNNNDRPVRRSSTASNASSVSSEKRKKRSSIIAAATSASAATSTSGGNNNNNTSHPSSPSGPINSSTSSSAGGGSSSGGGARLQKLTPASGSGSGSRSGSPNLVPRRTGTGTGGGSGNAGKERERKRAVTPVSDVEGGGVSPKTSAVSGGGSGSGSGDGVGVGSPLIRQNSFASVSSFEIEREESVGVDGEDARKKGRRKAAE